MGRATSRARPCGTTPSCRRGYRGVTFRSQGEAILHLTSPPGFSASRQQQRLAAISDLNRLRAELQPEPAIESRRIAAYELAFRMQMSAPDLLDFSQETATTLAAMASAHGTKRIRSPATACWRGGWSSGASGSCSSITTPGTTIRT